MLIQQIDPTIIVALIGVFGGALPAVITYFFTKNKEVDFSIRQEKTKRYDDLMKALFAFVKQVNTYKEEGHHKMFVDAINDYMSAYHRASAFAHDDVLRKCNDLHDEIEGGPEDSAEYVAALTDHIRDIYKAIRMDINPKAKYSSVEALWTASNEEENEPEELIEESGKSSEAPIK
jgi:hypothetical protein